MSRDWRLDVRRGWIEVVGSQVLALGASLWMRWRDWNLGLSAEDVNTLGQTLTMVLLAIGIFAFMGARKGVLGVGPLFLLGMAAPVYALLGGITRIIITYHAVSLGMQLLVIRRFWLTRMKQAEIPEEHETP